MPSSQGSLSATTTAKSVDLSYIHEFVSIKNDGSQSVYVSFSNSPSSVSSNDGFELKAKEQLGIPVNFRYINYLSSGGTQSLRYIAVRE